MQLSGRAAPVVANAVLGSSGEFMVTIMVLMTVMATGSTEVMAVTSILIYDIYQIYLKVYTSCIVGVSQCFAIENVVFKVFEKSPTSILGQLLNIVSTVYVQLQTWLDS